MYSDLWETEVANAGGVGVAFAAAASTVADSWLGAGAAFAGGTGGGMLGEGMLLLWVAPRKGRCEGGWHSSDPSRSAETAGSLLCV